MRKIIAASFLCTIALAPLPKFAVAETLANVLPNNQAVITDGLGVELRFDKLGSFIGVRSTFSQATEFPDRRAINKAYLIAEEKAKANIARYLNQVVTSSRFVAEVDEGLSRSARSQSQNTDSWNKENTRNVTDTLRDITTSTASAILVGARIFERSYDPNAEEVTVVIVIDSESLAGARQLKGALSGAPYSEGSVGIRPGLILPTDVGRNRNADSSRF
jgi:hypothetical protein